MMEQKKGGEVERGGDRGREREKTNDGKDGRGDEEDDEGVGDGHERRTKRRNDEAKRRKAFEDAQNPEAPKRLGHAQRCDGAAAQLA